MADARLGILLTAEDKASGSLSILEKQLERLERIASLPGLNFRQQQRLNDLTLKTTAEINKFKRAADQLNPSLQRISQTTNSANSVLINTGRIFQDLPFGIIGVANNINPLLESFQRLSVEAKASGQSIGGVLLQSLKGGGGLGLAFSLITGAASLATLGLSAFSRGFKGTGEASKKAKQDVEDFVKTLDAATSSFSENATKATSLVAALNSGSLNFAERKQALKDLGEINKEFFGSLKEEDGLIKGLQSAYDGYISRIKEVGRTKAIEAQLTKLFAEKLELELKIDPKFISSIDPGQQALLGTLKKRLEDLGGPLDTAKEKFDAFNKTQARRIELQQQINNLQQGKNVSFTGEGFGQISDRLKVIDLQINGLSDLLQNQGTFDIKLDKPKNELDKFINDTIAKAKELEKQFGDLHIFPRLDVDFTTTKEEAFKNALKVLEDFRVDVDKPITAKFKIIAVADKIEKVEIPPEFSKEVTEKFEKAQKTLLGLKPTIQFSVEGVDTNRIQQLSGSFNRMGDGFGSEFAKAFVGSFLKGLERTKNVEGSLRAAFIETKFLETSFNALAQSANTFIDAILNGQNVFKSFGEFVKNTFKQIAAEILKAIVLAGILQLLTGGKQSFGKSLGAVLGFRAEGGPVLPGRPYIVGEKGPELIIPKMSGTVVPNSNLSSLQGFAQNMRMEIFGRLAGNDILLSNARTAGSNRRNG